MPKKHSVTEATKVSKMLKKRNKDIKIPCLPWVGVPWFVAVKIKRDLAKADSVIKIDEGVYLTDNEDMVADAKKGNIKVEKKTMYVIYAYETAV